MAKHLRFGSQSSAPADIKIAARQLIEFALQKKKSHKEIAAATKRVLDKRYSQQWHCIVAGTNEFYMNIRYRSNNVVVMTGSVTALVFRSTPLVPGVTPPMPQGALQLDEDRAALEQVARRVKVMSSQMDDAQELFVRACVAEAVSRAQSNSGAADECSAAKVHDGAGNDNEAGEDSAKLGVQQRQRTQATHIQGNKLGVTMDILKNSLHARYGAGWHVVVAQGEKGFGSSVSHDGSHLVDLIYLKHRFLVFRHAEAYSIIPTLPSGRVMLYGLAMLALMLYLRQKNICESLQAAISGEDHLRLGDDAKAKAELELTQCQSLSMKILCATVVTITLAAIMRFMDRINKQRQERVLKRR